MEKLRTVRGVHDLLPDNLYKHNKVIKAVLNVSSKYCYSEIEIPIFEFSEVFKRPLGKSSDIVTKENNQPNKSNEANVNNISRNSLCPCGSGKKYKRCCGKLWTLKYK